MPEFICKKKYKGKNILGDKVSVPVDAEIDKYENFLLYKGKPICLYRSQVAKDYFVWNGDGCGEERWKLEQEIFKHKPFPLDKASMLQTKFPHLLNGDRDAIIFNDYFFTQSHISELKDVIQKLK